MKNNKGFSLVELIIVIAIMTVLVGVLAPTYLQYVEKSKKSNDVSTVDSIVNACETAAVDPETTDFTADGVTISISTTGTTVTANGGKNTQMKAAIEKIIDTTTGLKSSQWGASGAGTIVFTATAGGDGKVIFKYAAKTTGTGNEKFAAYATSITKIDKSGI